MLTLTFASSTYGFEVVKSSSSARIRNDIIGNSSFLPNFSYSSDISLLVEHNLKTAARRYPCARAFFQGILSDYGILGKKKKLQQIQPAEEKPPVIPPIDAEDPSLVEPYIPPSEVDTSATLDQDLVRTLSSKGSTSVTVDNISKTFYSNSRAPKTAVANVSVKIKKGDLVSLIGTSGSGKTTLMRMIAGLETPSHGKIFFNDDEMSNVRVQDRDVGVMFQSYALFKHMTAMDNITYGLTTSKRRNQFTKEEVRKAGQDLLDLAQLSELGDRYPQQLSGGQRQRVALARALATRPRVLLLDEPFGALDSVVKKDLTEWVRKLQKELQITTIMVTHDQDEALEMSDFMIVFHKGRVIQMGEPYEVFRRPNSPFVMNFMCEPKMFRSTANFIHRSGLRTTKPYVLVRPSDVTLHLKERRDLNTCPATVKEVTNFGPDVELELIFDDDEQFFLVMMRVDYEEVPVEVGQRVFLQIKPLQIMPCSLEDLE